MKDYQARVIEESDQLKARLGALFAFIDGPEFDGVDEYVHNATDSSLNPTSAISVSAWIKPDALARGTVVARWTVDGLRAYMLSTYYESWNGRS